MNIVFRNFSIPLLFSVIAGCGDPREAFLGSWIFSSGEWNAVDCSDSVTKHKADVTGFSITITNTSAYWVVHEDNHLIDVNGRLFANDSSGPRCGSPWTISDNVAVLTSCPACQGMCSF